jgi:hypothetical protein
MDGHDHKTFFLICKERQKSMHLGFYHDSLKNIFLKVLFWPHYLNYVVILSNQILYLTK